MHPVGCNHEAGSATYHDLLRLGKVVARVPVQPHLANLLERDELLGDDLGGVEDVDAEVEGLLLVDDLHVQLPLGVVALLDGVPEVLAVEIGVPASGGLGLLPDETGLSKRGLPVELDELGLALVVDEAVGVDAEAVLSGGMCVSCYSASILHWGKKRRAVLTMCLKLRGMP